MSTYKHIDRICAVVMAFALVITVLFMNGTKLGLVLSVDADSESHSDDSYFTQNDLDSDWDTLSATKITLEGDEAAVSGSGCYMYEGDVVIAQSGTYVVTGTLSGGSIVVNANDNSKVWILFDSVVIEREDDACLIVDNADKVFLTLAAGSENSLTSGGEYSEEALADNTDGAIFAHDDLTINGSGSLTVTAGYKHGIAANDDLVVTGGNIEISAPKDGIHANDSFRVREATLKISSQDDGIQTDNDGSYIYIGSGELDIDCGDEGIAAAGDITVAGGEITVSTGTERGCHGFKAGGTCTVIDGSINIESCYEGIQSLFIDILGGNITICSADDGLNASSGSSSDEMGQMPGMGAMPGMTEGESGEMMPQGGQMQMPSGEEMTEGESGEMMPQGGQMQMPSGEEMTEGESGEMMPQGGRMQMPSGKEMTESESGEMMPQGGRMQMPSGEEMTEGADNTDSEEETPWIHISGGEILIINENGMDADGIDSNGDILISGGNVRVSVTNSGSNSAIDYASESGGTCEITGGTVIACGSYSMAEGFGTDSAQGSVLYTISGGVEAGTEVSLQDADGNELLSWTVPCAYSAVTFSCPQMESGETYQITVNGESEEVTLSEIAVSAGDAQSTMFGGAFQMGGNMQGPGNMTEPPGMAEPAEVAESTETAEPAEVAESTETAESMETAESTETAESYENN